MSGLGQSETTAKKRWEEQAELMLRASKIRKGLLVTPASKERYVRKAYRLLMRLHEQVYWSLSDKPARGHRSRKILKTRRIIRERLEQQAREMMQAAVTVADHKKVIAGLKERLEAQRKAALEAFRVQRDSEEDEIERMKAEVKARERMEKEKLKPAEEVRRRRTPEEVAADIRKMKAEVKAREKKEKEARRAATA